MAKTTENIQHFKTCKTNYPEKPLGETKQAVTKIPIGENENVITCNDCGAFIIEQIKEKSNV